MEDALKGIGSLPEHLFVDILALLQSHEIAQAGRVCKRWNAVASTPYLWSHLSFITSDTRCEGKYLFTAVKATEVPWRKIVERAKGRVVSVELAYVSHRNIAKLAAVLLKQVSSSLKHIIWSVPSLWGRGKGLTIHPASIKSAGVRVLQLAQACPQLASLEVMSGYSLPPELFLSGKLSTCRLERFRTDTSISSEIYAHLLNTLELAKVVIISGVHYPRLEERWLHDFLRKNTVIEDLKLEALCDERKATEIATSLSLSRLDLSEPHRVMSHEATLHFPNLRELTADARMVCKLSVESLSNLTALHLSITRQRQDGARPSILDAPVSFGPSDLDGFERIKDYAGAMTLTYNAWFSTAYVAPSMHVLAPYLASSDIVWPGLTRVTVHLGDPGSVNVLLRLSVARTAGSQGATKEQYESIANGTMPITGAGLAGLELSGPPICQPVHWHIHHRQCLSEAYVLKLLRQHKNLHFE